MPHLPLPSLEAIHVYGIPLDLIAHAFLGICISFFFVASGMRIWKSLLIVFLFALLKEAFDWFSVYTREDIYDPVQDISATMAGALIGLLLRPKIRARLGMGERPAMPRPTVSQPPLVVTDKGAIPRARKILSILRREDKKRR